MAQCYKVQSLLGATMRVDQSTGKLILSARSSDSQNPAVHALVSDRQPSLAFLVAPTVGEHPLTLEIEGIRNPVVAVLTKFDKETRRVTLSDPLTKLYASGPPVNLPHEFSPVKFDKQDPQDWETFLFDRVSDIFMSANVFEYGETIDKMFASGFGDDAVLRYILDAYSVPSPELLTAILPLLSLPGLERIAKELLTHPDLVARLPLAAPHDVWAKVAIPALASWISWRKECLSTKSLRPTDSASAQRPRRWFGLFDQRRRRMGLANPEVPASDRPRVQKIGPELDFLEGAGQTGRFVSFWHAVNTYARASVEPTKTVCIVATARNEGIYFLEWIAYHCSIGVEHFFTYTNDNEDNSDTLLECLAQAGEITWINNEVTVGRAAQPKAYTHAFNLLPDVLDYRWSFVLDLDEFFVFNPDRFSSLPDFLAWQDKRQTDAIAVNWTFISADDERTWRPIPLSRRNTRLLTRDQVGEGYRLVKTVSRPRLVMYSAPHNPVTDERRSLIYRDSSGGLHSFRSPPEGFQPSPQFADSPKTENASVYHYIYKSAEEYIWKSSRNRGDHAMTKGASLPDVSPAFATSFIVQHDAVGLATDRYMQRCCVAQDREIERLMKLPGVAEAFDGIKESYRVRVDALRKAYAEALQSQPNHEHHMRFLHFFEPV